MALGDATPPRGEYEAALALHRAGRLEQAQAAYEGLLEPGVNCPDLLGLLGVVALQRERRAEAEALLRRALAAGGDARLRLRNLNNLVALLRDAGRRDEARDLLAGGVPDWPDGRPLDPAARETVLSLGRALLMLDHPQTGLRLVHSAFAGSTDDLEAQALTGRLLLALGQPQAALDPLERAAGGLPADFELQVALITALKRLGRDQAARAALDDAARRWPVYSPARGPSQRAEVLVINGAPRSLKGMPASPSSIHFNTNVAAQIARRMRDELRFHSVFGDLPPGALPAQPPEVDVVLNNLVNGETMNVPGRLERALEAVRWAGRPVINHPEAVAATTRQKSAALLQGIPGLKVPRIERYRIGAGGAPEMAVLDDIETRFGYPVILRNCQGHKSADHQHDDAELTAVLAHDRRAAQAALADLGAPEIYAVEYVPLRKKSGHFRKVRALLAEDEIVMAVPGFYSTWMVSSARRQATGMAFYRAHPETVAESLRIVTDPASVLGTDCLRVLEAIRDRMPLDFFGIDFDVDDDGQVVFFEANAAMNLLKHPNDPADIALPDEPSERVIAAFRRAVERRLR